MRSVTRRRGASPPWQRAGTSRRCGSRRPGRASGSASPQRGQGGRPAVDRPRCRGPRRRERAHQLARPRRAPSASSSSETSASAATARAARARAPRPSRCCRSRRRGAGRAAPRRSRAPVGARAAARASRRGRAGRRGCPARGRRERGRVELEHRARSRGRASRSRRAGRATACPRARRRAAGRCQRPLIRRWLRSTSPPSKRSRRFLPTRLDRLEQPPPSSRSATRSRLRARVRRLDLDPLADERLEPRAARWSESPSGIVHKRMHRSLREATGGRRGARPGRSGGALPSRSTRRLVRPRLLGRRGSRAGRSRDGPRWRPLGSRDPRRRTARCFGLWRHHDGARGASSTDERERLALEIGRSLRAR